MYAKCLKRVFDFSVSLVALICIFPILLILVILGAIFMGGNPFFCQDRPGKIDKKTGEEKIFKLIKFRTMDNRRDAEGNLLPDDVRLNSYGRFLRSTSLDELPEFINILIGDMSFVGPRPLLVKYLPLYSKEQRKRHLVRPGLTGYAQVNGRNSITWEEKFAYDVEYVNNVTFIGDIKILVGTVFSVLKREGISQENNATMEEFKGSEFSAVEENVNV